MCRNWSAIVVPRPMMPPRTFCGCLNRISPASGSGLTAMMCPPLRLVSSSAVNIRGMLAPGLMPDDEDQVGLVVMSSRPHGALADPEASHCSAAPLDSWHMLLQSGRLLVPKRPVQTVASRNAASLLTRPEV